MLKFKTKCQSGFTLLEIIIALFVFSIGILGLSTMQLTSLKGNSKAARITETSNVTADRFEIIIGFPYDSHNNGKDDDGDGHIDEEDEQVIDVNENGSDGLNDLPPATDVGPVPSTDGHYNLYWNVAIDHPTQNTKTIKIFVDPIGGGKVVSMVIIKADIGN